MKTTRILGALAVAALAVAGCEKQESAVSDDMAVSVAGRVLTRGQIESDVKAMVDAKIDQIPEGQREYAETMIKNQLVQSWIIESALVARAAAAGYTVTEEDIKAREAEFVKSMSSIPDAPKSLDEFMEKFPLGKDRAREELEHGILIDKFLKAEVAKVPLDVTEEANSIIARIAADNAKNAATEADAEKRIGELKAVLDQTPEAEVKAKFAELAKAESGCPSSRNGGDLGTFTHGQMVKEFDDCAFALPVGKVSDPVKTQFGYHLILVTEKTPAVEAKGDEPAVPESVRASHILIKVGESQSVPTIEEVTEYLKGQRERGIVQEIILKSISEAGVKTAEDYSQFLPPRDEPETGMPVEAAPAPETPAAE